MSYFNVLIDLKFFISFIILQILIIFLTVLRSRRFCLLDSSLIKKRIDIKELQFVISLSRFLGFLLPFKIGEILSIYIIKKKIFEFFRLSASYVFISKFLEFFILISIAIFICLIFFFETRLLEYNEILKRISYIILIILTFSILFFIKKNKKFFFRKKFKNKYLFAVSALINSKNFVTYTYFISSTQFICTVLFIFISTDRTIDNELFFLSATFIFLNAIPFKLPLGLGIFDIVVFTSNFYSSYGLSLEDLLVFRILQLIVFFVDNIFWYLVYKLNNFFK